MELSFFLAQLFGLTMMLFLVTIWLRPKIIDAVMDDLRPYSFTMLMAGFVGVVGGLAVILSHNVWEASWRVIITLFGWAALIKGITYVAFPEVLRGTAKGVLSTPRRRNALLLVAFLVSAFLTVKGFGIM